MNQEIKFTKREILTNGITYTVIIKCKNNNEVYKETLFLSDFMGDKDSLLHVLNSNVNFFKLNTSKKLRE